MAGAARAKEHTEARMMSRRRTGDLRGRNVAATPGDGVPSDAGRTFAPGPRSLRRAGPASQLESTLRPRSGPDFAQKRLSRVTVTARARRNRERRLRESSRAGPEFGDSAQVHACQTSREFPTA